MYDVIENRIGVFKLKTLEEDFVRKEHDMDIEDLPFVCDGSSPLPDFFHRKILSPQAWDSHGFAVPVPASTSPRSIDSGRQSPPWRFPSSPRATTSRSRERSRALAGITNDGYQAKRQRFGGFVSPNESRTEQQQHMSEDEQNDGTRQILMPPTATLILGIIPNEQADETISGNAPSASDPLEAKAESTVNTLLHRWTYVAPKVFSATAIEPHQPTEIPTADPGLGGPFSPGWGSFSRNTKTKGPLTKSAPASPPPKSIPMTDD